MLSIRYCCVRGCNIRAEANNITHFLICLFYLNLTEKSDDWNQAEYLPGPIIGLKLLRTLMTRLSDAGRKRDREPPKQSFTSSWHKTYFEIWRERPHWDTFVGTCFESHFCSLQKENLLFLPSRLLKLNLDVPNKQIRAVCPNIAVVLIL